MTHRRTPISKDRPSTASGASSQSQHGCERSTLGRWRSVSHGVDAAMQPVKVPYLHTRADCGFAQSGSTQLVDRNNSVLPGRELGNPTIDCGAFPMH